MTIIGPLGPLETILTGPLETAKGIAVICHPHPLFGGSLNNKVVTILHKAFFELGLTTVRFNFRGVGTSAGQYSEGVGELEDLQAVINWLKQKAPLSPLWLAGFSFGAYIVAKGAALSTFQQVILVAPPVQHFDLKHSHMDCPCLVIQGEEDEVVPSSLVYEWCNSLEFPYELFKISGAGHFFHGKLIGLKEQLKHYLLEKHAYLN